VEYIIRYFDKIYKALNYLLWNKVIIVGNLYEHLPENANFEYKPNIFGNFVNINEMNFNDYCHYFPIISLNYIEDRFYKYHDVCIAYIVKTKIVYWAFITCRNKYYEPAINTYIDIPEDAALIYDTTTLIDYRRKGIHAAAFPYIFDNVVKLFKNKAVMMVLKVNTPAINNLQKFNFKLIRRYFYFPFLGVTTWCRNT